MGMSPTFHTPETLIVTTMEPYQVLPEPFTNITNDCHTDTPESPDAINGYTKTDRLQAKWTVEVRRKDESSAEYIS